MFFRKMVDLFSVVKYRHMFLLFIFDLGNRQHCSEDVAMYKEASEAEENELHETSCSTSQQNPVSKTENSQFSKRTWFIFFIIPECRKSDVE